MTNSGSDWRREQMRRTLDHWRESDFDPHIVLGVPTNASQYQIVDAHRRWVAAYHPDRHGNNPIAAELTKRVNAARDALLGDRVRMERRREEQRRCEEQLRHRQRNYRPPSDTGTRSSNRRHIYLLIAALALVGAGIVAYIGISEYRSDEAPASESIGDIVSIPDSNPTNLPDVALIVEPTETPISEPTSAPYPTPAPLLATPIPTPVTTTVLRTSTPYPTPVPMVVTPTSSKTPTATPSPKPTATYTPTNTPTPTQSPTPITPSELSDNELKAARDYALTLINQARNASGLNPVILGDNIAAQLHAESALENCFSSHWGIDGLKPSMRYSLGGGYQYNAENMSGLDYCITARDGYAKNRSVEHEIRDATEGLLQSPGHRRNILNKWHKKVNIGIAMDDYNFRFVQHFEGDYVEYSALPKITNGIFSFMGNTINGAHFEDEDSLGVQIFYDPPVHTLTRGQVSRTYCVTSGMQIASLRPPLEDNWYYNSDVFTIDRSRPACPDPYEVPIDAPPPRSADESHDFWQAAYDTSQSNVDITITVPWITASDWIAADDQFSVTANIFDLLAQYGNGVYTIVVWAEINGEDVPISEYSIFIPQLNRDQANVLAHVTATPVQISTPSPTPTVPPIITSTPISTSSPTPIVPPTVTPTPTITPTPTTTPSPTPTATTIPETPSGLTDKELRDAREYVWVLINETRLAAGLRPIGVDDNTAAQSHANDMRANCFLSHWGTDGLKPYMRHTLSGGQQYSAENVSGFIFCPTETDRYIARSITEHLDEAMEGLMNSPGHRENILNPHHRKVNIGIAYQQPNLWMAQLFVGDYVEIDQLFSIENGMLSLSGTVKNGADISGDAFGLQLYFDQSPHGLTRGQLHNTNCYGFGLKLAQFRPPLEPFQYYLSDAYLESGTRCLDPYDVSSNAPAATSYFDPKPSDYPPYNIQVPWVTATDWYVTDDSFAIEAEISDLLTQHGNGVYTILLRGEIDGEPTTISEYSIFIPPRQ